jgi:hypothetical protein
MVAGYEFGAPAPDEVAGGKVFASGENNLAIYEIDQETGETAIIQNALEGRTEANK